MLWSNIILVSFHSMRYDTASATYTLQVKDVQRSDEATYQCQIIVGINNKVTKHLTITVSQPPVIADNSTRSIVKQVSVGWFNDHGIVLLNK